MHSPELEQHRRIAADLVAVYNSADQEAATRLNDLFHSALNTEQIHDFIRDKLFNLPDAQRRIDNFTLDDAQQLIARLYGFKDWDELVQSNNEPAGELHSAGYVLSSKPPFYRIDWANNSIEPRQPMSTKDWENLCAVIKEHGLTGINSASLIGDDDLEIISPQTQGSGPYCVALPHYQTIFRTFSALFDLFLLTRGDVLRTCPWLSYSAPLALRCRGHSRRNKAKNSQHFSKETFELRECEPHLIQYD